MIFHVDSPDAIDTAIAAGHAGVRPRRIPPGVSATSTSATPMAELSFARRLDQL